MTRLSPPRPIHPPGPTVPRPDGYIERGTREFFWTSFALFAAGFSTFALLYCVQPIMPLFSHEFALSPAQASLSLSVATQALAAAILIAGSLSEVFGRKRVMAISIVSASLLVIASAFAPNWSSFLILRCLAGLAFSGLPATAMAYIGEEMHADDAGMTMGIYISGTGLGALGGRLLVSLLADHLNWRAGVLTVGLLSLAAGALFWLKLPRSRHFTPHPLHPGTLFRSAFAHLKDPVLLALFAQGFLLLGAYMAFFNYLGYRLMAPPYDFSASAVGMIFLVSLAGIGTAAYTADFATRLGRPLSVCLLILIMLVGILATLAPQVPIILFGATLLNFAFYGSHSIVSGWVSVRARRGKSQAASFYLFSYYTGSSLIGWGGGYAWSAAGWSGVLLVIAASQLLALLIAVWLRRTDRSPANGSARFDLPA